MAETSSASFEEEMKEVPEKEGVSSWRRACDRTEGRVGKGMKARTSSSEHENW